MVPRRYPVVRAVPGRDVLGSTLLYSLGKILLEASRARNCQEGREVLVLEERGVKGGIGC